MSNITSHLTQSFARRIAKNSFWSVLGTGAGRVLNLFAMILAARSLGAEGFGAFGLVQSTLGLFGMFAGAALGATATRFIAAMYRTNPERTGRIIGLVSGSAILSALFFAALIVALAPWIASTILAAPHLAAATAFGAGLVGLGVLRGVQDSTLAGFEAFREIALLRFLEGLVAVLTVPLLVSRFGPAGGITGLGIGLLLAFFPGIGLTRRQLQRYSIQVAWRDAFVEWRLLRDFSAPSLISSTVATPVMWFCTLMLSRSPSGFTELGIFKAADQWHGPIMFVPMMLASVSIPVLVQAWEEEDRATFRRVFRSVAVLAGVLAFLPALVVIVLSAQIMAMYGWEFRGGQIALVLLMLAAPMHVVSKLGIAAIQSMNRPWFLVGIQSFWGIMLTLMALVAIPVYGANGLAFTFFISHCALLIIYLSITIWLSSNDNRKQSSLIKGQFHIQTSRPSDTT